MMRLQARSAQRSTLAAPATPLMSQRSCGRGEVTVAVDMGATRRGAGARFAAAAGAAAAAAVTAAATAAAMAGPPPLLPAPPPSLLSPSPGSPSGRSAQPAAPTEQTIAKARVGTNGVRRIGSHASACAKSTPADLGRPGDERSRRACLAAHAVLPLANGPVARARAGSTCRSAARLEGKPGRRGAPAVRYRFRSTPMQRCMWKAAARSLSTKGGAHRRRAALGKNGTARVRNESGTPTTKATARAPMVTTTTTITAARRRGARAAQGAAARADAGVAAEPSAGDGRARRAGGRARGRRHRLVALAATFEDTDDAQIDGHIASVSARLSANVAAVHVDDKMRVKEGELLVELDPRDYQVARGARRGRAGAGRGAAEARRTPTCRSPSSRTQTRVVVVRRGRHQRRGGAGGGGARPRRRRGRRPRGAGHAAEGAADLTRYRYLVGSTRFRGAVRADRRDAPRRRRPRSTARGPERAPAAKTVEQARARLAQAQSRAQEASQNAPHQLFVQRANIAARESAVRAAKAALSRPSSTSTTRASSRPTTASSGGAASSRAITSRPARSCWRWSTCASCGSRRTSRRRSSRDMQGRPARARARRRARPRLRRQVDSFGAASGSRFSLLPPENATGNYVKVVQRMPVRVRLRRTSRAPT